MFVGSQALSSSPEMTVNVVVEVRDDGRKRIHCVHQIGLTLSLFVEG